MSDSSLCLASNTNSPRFLQSAFQGYPALSSHPAEIGTRGSSAELQAQLARLPLDDLLAHLEAVAYAQTHPHPPQRSTPIHHLPTELLSQIFITWADLQLSDPTSSINNCPTIVAPIVCRRWRNTALGCPRLWSRIDVDFTCRHGGLVAQALRRWVKRAGICPLHVRLRHASGVGSSTELFKTRVIMSALVDTVGRWEAAYLSYAGCSSDGPSTSTSVRNPLMTYLDVPMPNLKYIRIQREDVLGVPDYNPCPDLFLALPSLLEANFTHAPPPSCHFPQLTTLSLSYHQGMSQAQLVELLSRTPALETLRIARTRKPDDWRPWSSPSGSPILRDSVAGTPTSPIFRTTFELPQLKNLTIDAYSLPIFLDHCASFSPVALSSPTASLARLESLTCTLLNTLSELSAFLSLNPHLSTSLRRLTMQSCCAEEGDQAFVDILNLTPALEELELVKFGVGDGVLEALGRRDCEDAAADEPGLCPGLSSLLLTGCAAVSGDALVRMLRSRQQQPGTRLGWCGVKGPPHATSALVGVRAMLPENVDTMREQGPYRVHLTTVVAKACPRVKLSHQTRIRDLLRDYSG